VHRDGHFQLSTDPVAELRATVAPPAGPRKIKALQFTAEVLAPQGDARLQITEPKILAVRQGAWYQPPNKGWNPKSTSFVNRTENWVTLSHVASGKANTAQLELAKPTPRPTLPPERYKKQPSSWPTKAWNEYQRAYTKLAPLRSGAGNAVVTGLALFLGPDCCILKILYVFFSMDGEDDYPYIPRGCGDMFDFALNANSIPVPWMLIVGALFIVTGTHSTANSVDS
jgi:hypothetical protein